MAQALQLFQKTLVSLNDVKNEGAVNGCSHGLDESDERFKDRFKCN
jgi:hypothetical protein